MGRAFEFRKARKMKRWGNMARTFTRIGKEIAIAVKAGGPEAANNPRLRVLMQNAKAANMPKDNVERAIKRASSKEMENYKEINYEGYGPYGVAIFVESATDNNTRTVANVRSYFTKSGGSLGTQGCLGFLFDHKSVFKVAISSLGDMALEDFELELIDFEIDELFEDESEVVIYAPFESYGKIQHYLDEKGIEIISGEFERMPTGELKELDAEQTAAIEKLLDKFEDDEDVTNVFHNAHLFVGEEE
ncbi:MAG: YebC/PmpR family DNA-binding transcriptional regulator [Rikenellaceae bacterium]